MHNLIEFLAKYNHWFVFILLEVISFVLLFQYNSYQGSVWFSSANVVSGKIYEWNSEIEAFFSLSQVNEKLVLRNVYLEQQVRALSDSLTSKTQDSSYLRKSQMVLLQNYRLISAKVVSNSITKADNFITLDKGSADGVKKDMGVISGTGVVGIVYLVSTHYSIVIPVLNTKSNISCCIQGRDYFGYLHWTGGNSKMAYVDDIPRHAHFKLYDKIVTSGYSSVFPSGVLVGKIMHVYNSSDGLSYRLKIELSTDFGNLRDVCIIDNSLIQERIELFHAAQDSIKPKEE
ncbi:rod shape-determining protein MreC [Segatella bryantii]|uniref:Cell shape-determining protein MreC n=1 Tax=Segatella bryantii TaxID=77095 RepID=A0ABX4EJJ8_SEGBR|nr:rod shape-determining protein MreC [Segatella bryantii]OYP56534.1 rod shape-determining protein MreC [Segatella bryantii]UKK76029.1 rod shape-determining protein MreC [Segatella bryantii]UKK80701.1 rod shape-determining protein MreC [Segatella bryantii]